MTMAEMARPHVLQARVLVEVLTIMELDERQVIYWADQMVRQRDIPLLLCLDGQKSIAE
jgi:beta-xylosidase